MKKLSALLVAVLALGFVSGCTHGENDQEVAATEERHPLLVGYWSWGRADERGFENHGVELNADGTGMWTDFVRQDSPVFGHYDDESERRFTWHSDQSGVVIGNSRYALALSDDCKTLKLAVEYKRAFDPNFSETMCAQWSGRRIER